MSEVWWRDASDFPNINAQRAIYSTKISRHDRAHTARGHTLSTSPLSPPAASQRAHPAHAHSRHISKRCPPFSLAPRSPTTEGSHLRHTQHTEAKTLTILVRCTTRTQTDSHARSPAHLTASTQTHTLFFGRQRRKERPGYAALCVAMSLVPGCPPRGTAQRRRVSTSARGTYGGVCGRRRRCPQKRRHLYVECGGGWEVRAWRV